MRYLITYDIADDLRRDDIVTILSEYGPRVQLSVFECGIAAAREAARLRARPRELIEPAEDQIRIYPLDDSAVRGWQCWVPACWRSARTLEHHLTGATFTGPVPEDCGRRGWLERADFGYGSQSRDFDAGADGFSVSRPLMPPAMPSRLRPQSSHLGSASQSWLMRAV
jgi:CRISPR-associated protein Cas2